MDGVWSEGTRPFGCPNGRGAATPTRVGREGMRPHGRPKRLGGEAAGSESCGSPDPSRAGRRIRVVRACAWPRPVDAEVDSGAVRRPSREHAMARSASPSPLRLAAPPLRRPSASPLRLSVAAPPHRSASPSPLRPCMRAHAGVRVRPPRRPARRRRKSARKHTHAPRSRPHIHTPLKLKTFRGVGDIRDSGFRVISVTRPSESYP